MVEPENSVRSTLTISVAFEGHGIGRILVPVVVVPQARREMLSNLGKLKRQLESSPTS